MRTTLICKLCSLDSVTSRLRDVNKHGGWGSITLTLLVWTQWNQNKHGGGG